PPLHTKDAIADALTYFTYVKTAIDQSAVRKFDPKALDYRPDLDPFPPPDKGVIRYDVEPTPLPARTGKAVTDVPSAGALRQLAIYVRNGRVIDVRERVSTLPVLDQLERLTGQRASGNRDQRAAATLTVVNRL